MHWDLRDHITHEKQMSEAFALSVLLAFSGGFQDAYTYIVRDHVYANAQTGNVVLMSTYFMQGEWKLGLRYLLPLISFAVGVLIAEIIHIYLSHVGKVHWRQEVLVLEILIMFTVGFMPQELNLLANILVSFTCAMQVQSFRTVHGFGYASTMCIGNLRSGVAALADYLHDRDKLNLIRARYYFGVIMVFAIGAGIGGNLSRVLMERSVWVCCGLLTIGVWLMNWKGRQN